MCARRLQRYNAILDPFLRATMTLPRQQVVVALSSGSDGAFAGGPPAQLPVVLSLVFESLYNAGRDANAALLGLAALVVLLHPDVTGPQFLSSVRAPVVERLLFVEPRRLT